MANETFAPTSSHGQGQLVGGVSSAEDGDQLVARINPTTKRLLTDVSGISPGAALSDGRKTVATAGAAEALAASTTCLRVIITAELDNTGVIVIGGSTVVAALATRRGTPLEAGDSITIDVDNLADVFLDTTVNGDGVSFLYFT